MFIIEIIKRVGEECKPPILSLFLDKFNKFNNTEARILDIILEAIYHMTLKLL